jgi:phosphoribosylglycinamide formyltransferase-1
MHTFGWFSTGRDEAAQQLLSEVWQRIQDKTIPARIGFVFCSREKGDNPESDQFIQTVNDLGLPLYCLSSMRWNRALRERDLEKWRCDFHQRITEILEGQEADTIVLAGYMLIVSKAMCQRYAMINLHPAVPGGPKGAWQEVIWELISQGADTTGVMIHLVTEDLDAGPPLTYCTFPLRGKHFDPLWVQMGTKLGFMPLGEIVQEEGEQNQLFQKIRREGVKREIPLLVMTLKAFAEGRVTVRGGKIFDQAGRESSPVCLNEEIEAYLSHTQPSGEAESS